MPSYYIEYTVRFETEEYDSVFIEAEDEVEAREKVEELANARWGPDVMDVYFDSIEVEPEEPEPDDRVKDSKDPDQQSLEVNDE